MFAVGSILIVQLIVTVKSVPPDSCFAHFRGDDCGGKPTPVMYYYKPGSRCEVGIWKGCLPNINMFTDEYDCIRTCIFKSKVSPVWYHMQEEGLDVFQNYEFNTGDSQGKNIKLSEILISENFNDENTNVAGIQTTKNSNGKITYTNKGTNTKTSQATDENETLTEIDLTELAQEIAEFAVFQLNLALAAVMCAEIEAKGLGTLTELKEVKAASIIANTYAQNAKIAAKKAVKATASAEEAAKDAYKAASEKEFAKQRLDAQSIVAESTNVASSLVDSAAKEAKQTAESELTTVEQIKKANERASEAAHKAKNAVHTAFNDANANIAVTSLAKFASETAELAAVKLYNILISHSVAQLRVRVMFNLGKISLNPKEDKITLDAVKNIYIKAEEALNALAAAENAAYAAANAPGADEYAQKVLIDAKNTFVSFKKLFESPAFTKSKLLLLAPTTTSDKQLIEEIYQISNMNVIHWDMEVSDLIFVANKDKDAMSLLKVASKVADLAIVKDVYATAIQYISNALNEAVSMDLKSDPKATKAHTAKNFAYSGTQMIEYAIKIVMETVEAASIAKGSTEMIKKLYRVATQLHDAIDDIMTAVNYSENINNLRNSLERLKATKDAIDVAFNALEVLKAALNSALKDDEEKAATSLDTATVAVNKASSAAEIAKHTEIKWEK